MKGIMIVRGFDMQKYHGDCFFSLNSGQIKMIHIHITYSTYSEYIMLQSNLKEKIYFFCEKEMVWATDIRAIKKSRRHYTPLSHEKTYFASNHLVSIQGGESAYSISHTVLLYLQHCFRVTWH